MATTDIFAHGSVEDATKWLDDHPNFDINSGDENGWTPLHRACFVGNSGVVRVLLARPDIDVNQTGVDGMAAVHLVCQAGGTAVLKLLVADSRVNVDLCAAGGHSPLGVASFRGYVPAVMWLIASGREIYWMRTGYLEGVVFTPLEIARRHRTGVVIRSLIKRMLRNPTRSRQELRRTLGISDAE